MDTETLTETDKKPDEMTDGLQQEEKQDVIPDIVLTPEKEEGDEQKQYTEEDTPQDKAEELQPEIKLTPEEQRKEEVNPTPEKEEVTPSKPEADKVEESSDSIQPITDKKDEPDNSPVGSGDNTPPVQINPLTFVYNNLNRILNQEGYNDLKRRGFTDEIISGCGIFSGGKYIENSLYELWSKDESIKNLLLREKILHSQINHKTGEVEFHITDKLRTEKRKDPQTGEEKPRIIIPYFTKEGNIEFIYPHKDGLSGQGLIPYCDYLLSQGNSETVIITESPLKALALFQIFGGSYGYCGLSGISSFAGKHFENFSKTLKLKYNYKNAIIIFDTEIKHNPAFPNYKENFWDRYNNEYWAYLMGWKLKKAGINTTIATLPYEWMVNGKIDCDGALAQGKTRDDFQQVINNALSPYDYQKQFTGEQKWVLDRKIKKYFYFSTILEEFNKYYTMKEHNEKEKKEGKTPVKILLTNFTMELTKTVNKMDIERGDVDVERYIQFTNEYKEKSQEFKITAEEMTNLQKFKSFIMSKGNYLLTEDFKTSTLSELWEKLMIESESPEIWEYSGFGKTNNSFWLFADCLIFNGQPITLNNKKLYQLGHQAIYPPGNQRFLPYLMGKEEIPLETIVNLFYKSIGYKGIILLSFVTTTLFSDVIFKTFKQVPLLGIFGKTRSGKTTAGRWVFACMGINEDPLNIATSTENGLIRGLSQRTNLPLWVDEYRANERTEKKTQTLLNVYNRAGSFRAEYSNDNKTLSYEIKGTLIISGQSTPNDEALYSRMVGVDLSEWERNSDVYNEIQQKQKNFSNFTLEILKREEEIRKILPERIEEYTSFILSRINDSRTAENYGACLGSLDTVFEVLGIEDKLEFDLGKTTEQIINHIKNFISYREEKDELLCFFRDVNRILSNLEKDKRELENGGILQYAIPDKLKGIYSLAMVDLWAMYEKDLRERGSKPTFNYTDIISYIEKEPYFRGYPKSKRQKRFCNKKKVCINLDYSTTITDLFPVLNFEKTEEEEEGE